MKLLKIDLPEIRARLAKAKNSVVQSFVTLALFGYVIRLILVLAVMVSAYWLVFASDRYVSEATVIIQKTDQISGANVDLSTLIGINGAGGADRPDQLLLREYLLSVDMLKKLDAALDLRSHYSGWHHDLVSRMWLKHEPMEFFYRHYLSRVTVDYDDYAGVIRIKVQAYDPKMAKAIADMLVQEGENHMNQLGHELAEAQVTFLSTQVDLAQQRFQEASQDLLHFQNKKGLVSPEATADSINVIIAKLEGEETDLQTKLASLPATLDANHPSVIMLKKAMTAVEQQIAQERSRLASTSGKPLNSTVDEFDRLKMEVDFTQDLYKTALAALEHGRMDATRMLKKVSVLQSPTLPEFPMEPERIYDVIVTLLLAAMLAGIVKLLESIIRDHVD